jgi:hypothetical protein
MPARKTWLVRVAEIRAELSAMTAPVIDRAVCERLFRVRRRRALQLMQFFGGWQSSQALLIDRLDLLRQLEPLEAGADYVLTRRRRERLVEVLENARRQQRARRVQLPVEREAPDRGAESLPDGVLLDAGNLNVRFENAGDLLAKLYRLSQAAAADFDAFRRAAEGGG